MTFQKGRLLVTHANNKTVSKTTQPGWIYITHKVEINDQTPFLGDAESRILRECLGTQCLNKYRKNDQACVGTRTM